MNAPSNATAPMSETRLREIIREEIAAAGPWVCGACGAIPSPTCPHREHQQGCGVPIQLSSKAAP